MFTNCSYTVCDRALRSASFGGAQAMNGGNAQEGKVAADMIGAGLVEQARALLISNADALHTGAKGAFDARDGVLEDDGTAGAFAKSPM